MAQTGTQMLEFEILQPTQQQQQQQQPGLGEMQVYLQQQQQQQQQQLQQQQLQQQPINQLDMINTQVALPTAQDYQELSDVDHILQVPDTYVGSVEKNDREVWVLLFIPNAETGVTDIESKVCSVTLPEAIERVFIEILSNAGDNAERSRRTEEYCKKVGSIDVKMDRHTITIRNGGVPIPIEKKENGKWVPEMIFGQLRTSSNYNKDDSGTYCGRNGFGAKLTNLFSTSFTLKAADPIRKLKYEQVWENNMKNPSNPVVEPYDKKESYVEVTYKLDFEYFQYAEYPDEAFYMFAQHVANIGFIHKIPVSFNGVKFKCQLIRDYCKLLFGEEVTKSAVVHYEWPSGTDLIERNGTKVAKDKTAKPIIEMCVLDTPDEGKQLSFVNGIPTRDGGVHVNEAYRTVSSTVLELINERMNGSKRKTKKKETTTKRINLNISDVKPHVTLVLNATLTKPSFSSQTKVFLNKPKPNINVSDKLQKKLIKWDLIHRLKATIEAKQFRKAKNTDGRKRRHLKGMKAEDANDAGTNNSSNCTALITEGDSAMAYAVKWISLIKEGRNTIGAFPLRGKPLNSLNADFLQVSDNLVFQRLKKFLGLCEGVDYRIEENYNKLRYGYLMILADADVDGGHIKGLLLLYLFRYFRSLLQRGCVYVVMTPIIRVYSNGTAIPFYSIPQYEQWKAITPNWDKFQHDYYKGLGTSTDRDIAQDAESPKTIACVYDDLAPQYFDLAFNSKRTKDRKEWLKVNREALNIEQFTQIPISTLIDQDLTAYAHENNMRSIPNYIDGLKPSQRKIMYVALNKSRGWTYNKIKEAKCEKKKVAQFGASVAAETEYHHGEQCMEQTIVSMTQSFTGSNNLPYFTEEGQFGTRNYLGKDKSSSRYIFIKPQRWLPYVFLKEDEPLYNYVIEEGREQEPEFMLPIIPIHLINGAQGIGTGHCTFIPNHNVIDICYWLINKMTGQQLTPLKPFYNKFTGTVDIVPRHKLKKRMKKEEEEEEEDNVMTDMIIDVVEPQNNQHLNDFVTNLLEEEEDEESQDAILGQDSNDEDQDDDPDQLDADELFIDPATTTMSMVVTGTYEEDGRWVTINEIPIGRSIHAYDEWLKELAENKIIKDVRNMSTHDKPLFHVEGLRKPNLRKLKLVKSFGLSTMVLMNRNNNPTLYHDANHIIEEFYNIRLAFYQLRKDHQLKKIQEDIDFKNLKIQFIEAVAIHKTIKVMNIRKDNVCQQMCDLNIPSHDYVRNKFNLNHDSPLEEVKTHQHKIAKDVYDKVKVSHCSVEEIEKLRREVQEDISRKNTLDQTPVTNIWLSDIQEFLNVYNRYYNK